ncbi:MAG: hypothetical protein QGI94_02105 [Candidatus Scalindua sp.]|nr:hypothetical protein [Candidatus Scalindua sp.]
MKIIFICFLLITLISACASKTVYISSQTDPRYSLNKLDAIFILFSDKASIADRQFYSFLKQEMVDNGFNIVEDLLSSSYILSFQTGSKTSKMNSTLFMPTTTSSSGYVGSTYYSDTSTTTAAIPYSYNYTVKKIYLDLYSTQDVTNKKYMTVWEGCIGAGSEEYTAYPNAILKSLLNVFGTNYKATTSIDTRYKK